MSDNNFNFKSFKPTLTPASSMGKKIDSGFKSKMGNVGVNMNTIKEETENKEDKILLKKKIFSLPKMETLVATDDYLHSIYEKMKTEKYKYGTHWSEAIHNILFIEKILDDPAYLQKYKNTKTIHKTRRGEEGAKELENVVQDRLDKKTDGENPKFDRKEKVADIETNKKSDDVNEIFNLSKPKIPLTTHKASKNDTYLVRKKDNTAVGVISPNLTPQENQDTAGKFADQMQYKRMPWYVAVTKHVNGVPAEVSDGSIEDFQADVNKYSDIPVLAEENQITAKFTGNLDDWSNKLYKGNNGKLYVEVDGQLHSMTPDGEPLAPAKNVIKMSENIDSVNKSKMTAGSGFELQFGITTDAEAKEAADKDATYQNETTTSASSGAFVGPFSGKRKDVLDKPLWNGGTIIREGKDYLTNPEQFKKYVLMVENVDKLEKMLNESIDEGSGLSIKQHAENIVNQLQRMKAENPDLNELPEFNELIDIYTSRAQTGRVENEPVLTQQPKVIPTDNTNQWKNISETPSFDGAMEKDLKYTGRGTEEDESTNKLEREDGLFKGKWNTNENFDYSNKQYSDKAVQIATEMLDAWDGDLEYTIGFMERHMNDIVDSDQVIKILQDKAASKDIDEKAVSKSQQKFMGMVHAAQTGKLEHPSKAVAKAAGSMSDKSVEDYASTKQKGLPDHVKENNEDKNMNFNTEEYKKFFKEKLKASGKSLGTMSPEDKKQFFSTVDNEYKAMTESIIDDQPDSMARTMDSPELNTTATGGASASVTENEVEPEEIETPAQGDRQDKEAIADAAKFREFLMSKYGVDSVADMSPRQKQEVMKDLAASRGGDVNPEVKPRSNKELDLKNFAATDAQKAEYKARDNKQLSFVAAHNNEVNSIKDYAALEKLYGQENGERMFHPMAILASIQAMPQDERMKYNNVEKVLTSQLKGNVQESTDKWEQGAVKHKGALHKKLGISPDKEIPSERINSEIAKLDKKYADGKKMSDEDSHFKKMLVLAKTFKKQAKVNEDRLSPSMLNLQNIKKETAALTQKDFANADALKQARVYPNPDEFYIEQDDDKVQDFKNGEELEKEALKTMEEKQALQNAGDSTDNNGKEITKRNLTKEEKLKLAMDRGDGMHNIVYDNEPAEKFEKRLEKDMGEDQYKLRQQKMDYRKDAPMYNKDTQPTENGDKKLQDNKFKTGYNEAFTGKYTNHNGKVTLVEFMLNDVKEVSSVEDGFKLTLDGLGNKYTVKINENKTFESDDVTKYNFYLVENNVVKVMTPNDVKEAKKDVASTILEDSMSRMSQLIKYNSGDFVNAKKSVRF